jgi:hypothetical protein
VAWQRIGLFATPEWAILVMLLTIGASVAGLWLGLRELIGRSTAPRFERYATWSLTGAALAWLAGFVCFIGVLLKGLGADDINEIMWWYPPAALIAACWTFAAAAALTLLALPGALAVGRANGWSPWRRGLHGLITAIFLLCAFELWRLSFLGFSGW